MKENEHKDSEKVLYKTRVRFSFPNKEPEEAECFITESNLMLESVQPVRIPLHQIKMHRIDDYGLSNMTLVYVDDLNQKKRLSLENVAGGVSTFDQNLRLTIGKAKERWLESLPVEERYVGFWRRFVAVIIDGIIVNIVSWLLALFLFFAPEAAGWLIFVLGIVYYVGFWVWQGATPGKMMMKIKIVKTDGSPIGVGRAILRYIGYYISTITLFIGYLMIAWDRRKQGLHDKIAGTCVVKTG